METISIFLVKSESLQSFRSFVQSHRDWTGGTSVVGTGAAICIIENDIAGLGDMADDRKERPGPG